MIWLLILPFFPIVLSYGLEDRESSYEITGECGGVDNPDYPCDKLMVECHGYRDMDGRDLLYRSLLINCGKTCCDLPGFWMGEVCEDDPYVCEGIDYDDCEKFPGLYMEFCPVTCDNCDNTVCMDSTDDICTSFPVPDSENIYEVRQSHPCSGIVGFAEKCPKTCKWCGIDDELFPCTKKDLCEYEGYKRSCPDLCGVNIVDPDTCSDDIGGCTMFKCKDKPGKYLQHCKKTCDNCDGDKCYDHDDDYAYTGLTCEMLQPYCDMGMSDLKNVLCPITCGGSCYNDL